MSNQKTITLLSGTAVSLEETRSIILPELHDDLAVGAVVTLENEKREFVGEAEVVSFEVETFALLQQAHFANNAHPELGSWPNAYAALQRLVPGFSQSDKVTVIVIKPVAVSQPGITVTRSEGGNANTADVVEPSEDEAYEALNDFIVEEHE